MKKSVGTLLQLALISGGSFAFVARPVNPSAAFREVPTFLQAFSRRDILSVATTGSLLGITQSVSAADEESGDLISQLFNADGSLKEDANIETEARFRTVKFSWKIQDDTLSKAVDRAVVSGRTDGSSSEQALISYNLPEKWDDNYLDRSEGVNERACSRITIYSTPGTATMDRLVKATRVGVAKALDVTEELQLLNTADLIGGRTHKDGKNGQVYYEFDLALAPKTCDKLQKEDLGLGFCPYESIFLLSSTVLDGKLYVFVAESDKNQWKRANADLRRVRSSFQVQRQQEV